VQVGRGYTTFQTVGLLLAPGAGALLAGIVVSPLVSRVGRRKALMCGLAIQAAGSAVLAGGGGSSSVLRTGSGLVDFGYVLAVVAATMIATGATEAGREGGAGGLLNVAIQFGAGLGITVVFAAARPEAHRLLHTAASSHSPLTRGALAATLLIVLALPIVSMVSRD
jgi:MFS family permease